jgi:predicted porin
MKIHLIACVAVAAHTVGTLAQAQSSVTLFGIVDASVESIKSGGGSVTRVQSGGTYQSRFGLRGTEDLGGGNTAFFNLENRFGVDDGSMVQGLLFGGRSVIGLAGGWGLLALGREYIPIYQVKTGSTPFVFMNYSSAQVMMRGGASKSDNALRYDSRTWAGASMSLMYSMGEENPVNPQAGRHAGVAAHYAFGKSWVGGGWNRVAVRSAAVDTTNEYVIGARTELGITTVYGNVWRLSTDNRTSPDAVVNLWMAGASAPVSRAGTLMATYARRSSLRPRANDGDDATQILLGYEHALSKRTTLYTQYSRVNNRGRSNLTLSGFANVGAGSAEVSDPRAFQVGMRHTF